MRHVNGWTARSRITWGVIVATAVVALVGTAAGGQPRRPLLPAEWLTLALLAGTAALATLRPAELGPDWKVSAASAPALALALLFDPFWAAAAGAGAMAVAQWGACRPWYAAVFNVAQRTLAVGGASALAAAASRGLRAAPGLAPGWGAWGLDTTAGAVVGAVAFFLINTSSVAAMSAARRGASWPATWRALVRAEGAAEAGLLAAGALLATLVRVAPAAIPLLVPPLWLAWRVVRDGGTIRELNRRLVETLAAQRRFVADAAHELRTPIASLRAQVEVLRREAGATGAAGGATRGATGALGPAGGEGPAPAAVLDQLARETTRLSAVLADLLALARADEGAPLAAADVDLEALLIEAYRAALPLAGRVGLQLDLDEGGGPPVVRGDAERLRQLVVNLLLNGLRFTPPGGRVTVRCRRDRGQAVVAVADTGVGIAPEDLPHIFERFYRADPARARAGSASGSLDRDRTIGGGAGLGLPIARWIAEAHGGSITVQSEPGEGSVFTVRLPLAAPRRDPPKPDD
jgi:signal transduction histidine kinase